MRRILAIFALLLLVSLPFAAACKPAVKTVNLAAVMEDGTGSIVPLEVEIRPGSGQMYTTIVPKTGMATQASEEDAIKYAFDGKNSECDVYFRIKALGGTPFVDGPSAGTAMALGLIAAIENQTVRSDLVITGTIGADGKVGDVGGIVEKSIASAKAGKMGILTPKQQIYEHIVLSTLGRDYAFTGREVETVDEAKKIAFAPAGTKIDEKFGIKSTPLPANLQPIEKDSDLQVFALITQNEIEKAKNDVQASRLAGGNGELEQFKKYIGDEIAKDEKLNELGYVYTGANNAFLLGIDTEFLKVGSKEIDMEGSRGDVAACLSTIKIPGKTAENFYWVTGANLRKLWGERKLEDTTKLMKETEVKYPVLHEMLFAQGWCEVAAQLAIAKNAPGSTINESSLARLADEKIKDAQNALSKNEPDSDALWHLDVAKTAYGKGMYAEAIFDATYAKTMVLSRKEMMENPAAAISNASVLAAQGRDSLWGKVYYGQAKYIYSQDEKDVDAYRLLRFSKELDAASSQIDATIADASSQGDAQEVQSAQTRHIEGGNVQAYAKEEFTGWRDGIFAACFLALLWVFGACVVVRTINVRWSNGKRKK
ncbi:Archaeal Lon protease [Candidatus Anstonella stagnisolia]|nr:Archaeal Lon protease [Candidatus Anstonella stagnisolia]